METPAQMCTIFVAIGFSAQAACPLTEDQELNNPAELALLSGSQVNSLIKLVQRHGGRIGNPDAAVVGQFAKINDPDALISMRTVTNLKLACFYLRHYLCTL